MHEFHDLLSVALIKYYDIVLIQIILSPLQSKARFNCLWIYSQKKSTYFQINWPKYLFWQCLLLQTSRWRTDWRKKQISICCCLDQECCKDLLLARSFNNMGFERATFKPVNATFLMLLLFWKIWVWCWICQDTLKFHPQFRKLSRILVCGKVKMCREVFKVKP